MKTNRIATVEVEAARLDLVILPTSEGAPIAAPLLRVEIDTATRLIRAAFVYPPAEMRLSDLVATLPSSTSTNN